MFLRFSLASLVFLFALALLLGPPAVEAQLAFTGSQSNLVLTKGVERTGILRGATGSEGKITYLINPPLPTGMSLTDDEGQPGITGTPTVGYPTTEHTLTARADGETDATLKFYITVNSPPEFSGSITPQTATVGRSFSLVLPAATQEDGDTTSYTLTGSIPNGLSFDPQTRTLAGTPTTAAAAVTLTYTADDSGGNRGDVDATITFTLTVNAQQPPAAPTGVTVTPGVGNVTVTWNGGANTGFQYEKDGGSWTSVSAFPLVLTGPAGTAISVRIRVAASGNTPAGTASASVSGTPRAAAPPPGEGGAGNGGTTVTTPAAPTGVSAAAGPGKITVTWNNGADTGFDYSRDGDPWASVSVYPLVLTGPAGTAISVRIRVAASGNVPAGTPSVTARATPTEELSGTTPAAPTGVSAAAGPGKITVTWNGGMTTAHEYSKDSGAWTSVSAYPLELAGPAGTVISVRIRVAANPRDNTAAGTPSEPATATPTPLPVVPQPPPPEITVVPGDGEITVTWDNCSAGGYEYRIHENDPWTSVSGCPLTLYAPNGREITVYIRKAAADGAPAGHVRSVTLTLPPDGIPAHGYAVLVRPRATTEETGIARDIKTIELLPDKLVSISDMPDLWDFFRNGGTIRLRGPAGSAEGDLKITEIMAAKDASLGARAIYSQWIEVYNRTDEEIDFSAAGWMLEFIPEGSPLPQLPAASASAAGRVDLMSNTGNPGSWDIKSTGGRTTAPAEADVVDLVSMYRKLKELSNTGHAEHADDDGNPERAATWVASKRPSVNLFGRRVGSPGHHPTMRLASITGKTVLTQEVLINEIGNSAKDANDWVELMNTTDTEINLKKWELNIVMADGRTPKETQLVSFPDNDATKLPAKGILLLTNTSPAGSGNDLAAGREINKSVDDRVKRGVTSLYYVDNKLVLPNDNSKYNLILRNANDKEGKAENIVDNGGTYFGEKDDDTFDTEVWPLQLWAEGHGDVIDGDPPEDFRAGFVYKRDSKNSGIGEHHWKRVGFTGIGYDRIAAKSDENGGTPGYANDALKEKITDPAANAGIGISEIMFEPGSGSRSLPQWIELYNASMIQGVNLNGWKLEIQNAQDERLDAHQNAIVTFGDITVAPNQTVLIVSTSGSNSGKEHFPNTRVINLWTDHREALGMEARGDTVLSAVGFYLKLTDKSGGVADEVGNTDSDRRTNDRPAWPLPGGMNSDGDRVSMIRDYIRNPFDVVYNVDGVDQSGWISAGYTDLSAAGFSEQTYYGHKDDLGTPGHHGGGPLPVSLSSFRPVRDTATGAVVIRWSTESEVNNAGFNILRSESKTGAFKVVNVKGMIPGHGTTAEKHVYTWTDTSAKPDVVYYYQIEDVSLDGKRTTLRTTHLRGNVTAAGKATTTWGQLKSQQ